VVVTEDEPRGGRSLHAKELGTDGHPTIRADPNGNAAAPNEGPPGTARDGTQDAAFVPLSPVPGLLGFHLKFAVEFVLVAMEAQVVNVWVGLVDVGNLFTGKVSG